MVLKKYIWILLPLLAGSSYWHPYRPEYIDVPIAMEVPSNFPKLAYDTSSNPPTQKGVELGKKLFYDGRLSSDGLISCAFCHIQEHAFTHHGHTVSHGVNDKAGTRNATPIQNLAFQQSFMWDGAADHLELQPIIPLTSTIEMDASLGDVVAMMKADASYAKLFRKAFKNGAVDTENMLKALSQFMAVMVSSNSRFDKFRRNEPGGVLDAEELQGYQLFNSKCATCHATDLMTDGSFRNNGLPPNPKINDMGRYGITRLDADRYRFKVPSLRNVEKTAPYMHDGRFGTLEAVMDHYTSGMADSPSLDPQLKSGNKPGILLSSIEKAQIVSFLKTLTDRQFLTDKRFSEY